MNIRHLLRLVFVTRSGVAFPRNTPFFVGTKLRRVELVLGASSSLCFFDGIRVVVRLTSRSYCSVVECSLAQLSADIEFIYNDLADNGYSMPRYRLAVIQQKRLSGLYVLSPLHAKFVKIENLTQFLGKTLPDCPDITFGPCSSDPGMICVVLPDKEDALVLMGLAQTLLRLSHGRLPKDGYRLSDGVSSFYHSLQQMGKVDRLYRLDLTASLRIIPISLLLDKVRHLVGEGAVSNLISDFLDLPIIDDDENHRRIGGIPPVGEITRVLFNIALTDIFDREFAKRFPGIAFSRFLHEVYKIPPTLMRIFRE